jgi:membrane associated rhomboid family serine protease
MRVPPKLADFPRYPVVAGTALLAIAVTLAGWANVDMSPLFETAMIRRGEVWRLVTSMLPHGGTLHLVFNIYWLWVFGTLIEETYGHFKTAALILLFAFGSGAWEFALASGGIGLSGVGYGLFGMLWMLSRHDERFRDAIDPKTVQLFIIWFFLCIITTVTKIMPVANIAHGTGAILGILIGLAMTRRKNRLLITAGISAILVLGLWGATLGRPRINLSTTAGDEEQQWGYEFLRANKNKEALSWLRDSVVYQPKNALFRYNLSVAQHRLGDDRAALASCRTAAEQGDLDAQYLLGSVYQDGSDGAPKDSRQALYWYGKAAAQNDAETLNSIAWTYVTSSDPAIRNPTTALEYARKAVAMEKDHPVPSYLDTLAEALYANQKYEDAVKTEQQAIVLASATEKDNFQKSLERYQLSLKGNGKGNDGHTGK